MSKIKVFSLGGLNETGKNMYVVEVDQDIYVFDAGLKYADDSMLGIDYIIPNYEYLTLNQNRIKGIFLSHGHDEQMGAISDMLIDMPNVKIYGTKFTLEMLKQELLTEHLSLDNLIEVKPYKKVNFGKNSIFPVSLTHSIPDAVGYVLNTLDGAIFYTGNFMFDATMLGNYKTDIGKLAYIGKQGVLCLLSESLYADKRGFTSPNHRMQASIMEALNKNDGRIICNVYSTQIYRIQEIFNAVSKTERKVVLLGKRLESVINDVIDMGYINFDKKRLANIKHVNDENVFVLISDEREKAFSNLQRILKGYDKFIKLNSDDTVILVSPIYDGSEKRAADLLDRLARMGVNTITISNKKYLDLHASSEDLMMMINLMNPKYYFPIMGDYRLQVENANAAKQAGMKEDNILLKLNGQVVEFVDGNLVDSNEFIHVDDIMIDGKTVGDIGELVIKDREALSDNGVVIVAATVNKQTKEILAGPEILTRGFIYVKDNAELINEAAKISLEVIKENTNSNYIDFNKVKTGIRDKLGKYLYKETECRPMILIVLQEV